ncbi:MAG: ABC transporter substrate-binding protein [Pseudorhodoplanes sp.]|jgi:NitT/TauT family transport system substrate-binding protein|nr:ABC transporter substrate-binding protein [Pseudorhodoplanes sp.]
MISVIPRIKAACKFAAAFVVTIASALGAEAADRVSVGVVNASSDIALFIADAKGYFKDADLEVQFHTFDSAAKMIAPLGAGQLDVGAGAASSGLYNAVERGINLRVVADKARNAPGYGFQSFMVRKALVDSGDIKSLADLKGRKVAIVAAASSDASVLNQAMISAGLRFSDVEKVYLGFSKHMTAFQNGAIDASITTEPTVSALIKAGVATRLTGNDAFYPNAQTAVILYGGEFATKRSDVAKRFMKGYIRAVRDYNNALKDGHLAGNGADELIEIFIRYGNIKDKALLKTMTTHGANPDGWVNVISMKNDWLFFKDNGQIKGTVAVDDVLDRSFVDAALKELGPYKKSGL